MKKIEPYTIGTIVQYQYKILEVIEFVIIQYNSELCEIPIYKIAFEGNVYHASHIALESKSKNLFTKCISNVGYRGLIDIKLYEKEYKLWKNMLYRCYNQNNTLYQYFGARGITVCDKWLCFELFLYDLINMDNYNTMINDSHTWEIDIAEIQFTVPDYMRIYEPGKVKINRFGFTDVGRIYFEVKNSQNDDILTPYRAAIKNSKIILPKFIEEKIPAGATRTFSGVVYSNKPLLVPVSSPYSYINGKPMCKIITDID